MVLPEHLELVSCWLANTDVCHARCADTDCKTMSNHEFMGRISLWQSQPQFVLCNRKASMATCKHLCVPDVSAVRCSCKLWLVGSAVVWEMIMDEAYFRAQLQLARDRAAQRRGDPPPARIRIMPNSVGAAGHALGVLELMAEDLRATRDPDV